MDDQVIQVGVGERLWVVSDLHLRDNGDDGKWSAFQRLIERAVTRKVPIVCGGDFFHLFLGRRDCWTPVQTAAYHLLAAARESGLQFFWIRGNRDLHPQVWQPVLAGVGSILYARVGAHDLVMIHGHGINRKDWADWLWQRVLHHPITWRVLGRLPAGWLTRLADAVERRLHHLPSRRAKPIPWHVLHQQAVRMVDGRPVRWFLYGHFHVFARITNPIGCPREILCVPSWDEGARILEFLADGTWTLLDENGHPLDVQPMEPLEVAPSHGPPHANRRAARSLG